MFFEHDLLGKSVSTFRDHALEVIIDACAHHVHLNASAVGQGCNAGDHDSIVDGAQVDIELLKLCAPVRTEREFGAAADGPAAWRRVLAERGAHAARGRGALERDASEGITAGGISEPAVGSITDPGAGRAEPIDIVFKAGGGWRHADRTLRVYATFGITPVKIAFHAHDQCTGLPIEPPCCRRRSETRRR